MCGLDHPVVETEGGRFGERPVVLEIGGTTGALVVYGDASTEGHEIEISRPDEHHGRAHNVVRARPTGDGPVFAAVFPALEAGAYLLHPPGAVPAVHLVVTGGHVTEADCRSVRREPVQV